MLKCEEKTVNASFCVNCKCGSASTREYFAENIRLALWVNVV